MYVRKDLQRDEGRKVQKRGEKCKNKSKKIRKKRNNAYKCENVADSFLLDFQKAR